MIPGPTVVRLSVYRRLLRELSREGRGQVFSHELAERANNSSAQVRRDLMSIGLSGRPRRGYEAVRLADRIGEVLGHGRGEHRVALIGVGNLGRAILAHFAGQSELAVVAAFDVDEGKVDRVIAGCRCHHLRELGERTRAAGIDLAVLTVPASAAQEVADQVVAAGITGILNFAPVPLRLPAGVFSDRLDIGAALEKVAYFASGREAGVHTTRSEEAWTT
jgi:redox-sensing transcriptional repressor